MACVFRGGEGAASPSGEDLAEGRHTVLTLRLVVGFKFAQTGAPASPIKTDLAATTLDSVLAIYKANSYLLWDFFHLP